MPSRGSPVDIMGFIAALGDVLGYAAPVSRSGDEQSTEAALQVARSWAGLTSQGRILISLEELERGQDVHALLSHESVHDTLLHSSVLGIQQLSFSMFSMPPHPEFSLSSLLRRMMARTIRASLQVQEGCATFLPSLGRNPTELTAYLESLPAEYRNLVQPLEWLRARRLQYDAATQLVFAIGRFSLGVRLPAGTLSDAAALGEFLRHPDHNPNERFAVASAALRSANDVELLRLAKTEQPETEIAQRWYVEGTGRPAPYIHVPKDPKAWLEIWREVVAEMVSAWTRHPRILESEREDLRRASERPEMLLQPPAPTVLKAGLSLIVSASGVVSDHPPVASLVPYELALLRYNGLAISIPGIEAVDIPDMPLAPGEAALWLASPTRELAAARLSDSELREYFSVAHPDTAICVYDAFYMFPWGDVLAEQPLLRNRFHMILLEQRSLGALLNDPLLRKGLAGETELRYAVLTSEIPGASYFLIAPKDRPSPVIVAPVPVPTSARACHELGPDGADSLLRTELVWTEMSPPDFLNARSAVALVRLLSWYEDKPWPPWIRR